MWVVNRGWPVSGESDRDRDRRISALSAVSADPRQWVHRSRRERSRHYSVVSRRHYPYRCHVLKNWYLSLRFHCQAVSRHTLTIILETHRFDVILSSSELCRPYRCCGEGKGRPPFNLLPPSKDFPPDGARSNTRKDGCAPFTSSRALLDDFRRAKPLGIFMGIWMSS